MIWWRFSPGITARLPGPLGRPEGRVRPLPRPVIPRARPRQVGHCSPATRPRGRAGGSDSERVCTGHHAPSSWTPGLPGGAREGASQLLGFPAPTVGVRACVLGGVGPLPAPGVLPPPPPAVAFVNITWSHGWFFCSLYEAGQSLLARTAGRQGGRPRGHRQARENVPHKASL